ncbi:MAG: sterol desaturase family protein, partial [Deltaproteobacteria bacterium]
MTDFVTNNEVMLRMAFFLGIFVLVALGEVGFPRRDLITSKRTRWVSNIGIVVINTILLRLIFPGAAVGIAVWVSHMGWGLFNNTFVPYWLAVVMSVVLLDFVIYLQHVIFHSIPALWRVHMMHHTDLDFDVTTGTRFHPVEI